MLNFRFKVGAVVMCNLGPIGWKLGRIIALHYREDHWPVEKEVPYQVVLEADNTLIYVPEDDDRYCREATCEDLRVVGRMDALAALPPGAKVMKPFSDLEHATIGTGLDYRSGQCHCCHCCPRNWSCVELYSEHYRCAERNGLKVTRHVVNLGTVCVGDSVHCPAGRDLSRKGFMQCPTLVRLPPGIRFSDDGTIAGEVRFDPHRDIEYSVDFVAVSTARWDDSAVGIVRLQITFVVKGNEPPDGFDVDAFMLEQHRARNVATGILHELSNTWELWELGKIDNHDTCDRMRADLLRLRELLDRHPRLDNGMWWAQLGGYYMNVHKLLENTLFECELYLGHALTFGNAEVRWLAEQNLKGCYQKRLLEAARFLWIDGLEQMMRGEWATAAETLCLAAAKKDGWGWAVNFGDIWFSESAARLIHGAELAAQNSTEDSDGTQWIAEAARLLERGMTRTEEAGYFGAEGHPWASEIAAALVSYRNQQDRGTDTAEWLKAFKLRTTYWCAQVLGGAWPFPPKPRPRLEDTDVLAQCLPGHND
ncbi:hypothetical protein [Candidatus Uabimicrobium amorphum]|uniref:Uncharacterized protein n=1 Tax=Uabimicrobium amorphum TaxID=2596890 RepID=A0A5S9IK65_UABAM|nr:hypothetical protein [Candidatus Uabimicrobium amorphum]BBM83368.1 hypothetical protein UABAM_01720 [Candidatus Uabimicrobium amorphum]